MTSAREETIADELQMVRNQHALTLETVGENTRRLHTKLATILDQLEDARQSLDVARMRIKHLESLILRWHSVDKSVCPPDEAAARSERARIALGVSCGR